MMTLPNLEKIDFSENGMSMAVSHSTNNYPNTINVYPNYTKLKEFIVPNLTFQIHCPANVFPNSPLEKIKIGYLYSGWAFYEYNRFEYRGLCKNKPTLKEVEIKTMNFDHAKSNLKEMFYGCTGLESFKLSTIDTTFNTDISYMFYNCASLEDIDLSWMKTKMVTTMAYLFYGCSSLKTYNIDNFDYTNTTSIMYMFANCSSLENVKLKIANAPLLKTALNLFTNCESLKTVDLTEADLSLVTSAEYWFTNCKSLKTLDLSYLNLNSITSAKGMFRGCIELEELDLSNFTFSKNFTCAEMFKDCISLKKLDIRNWQINKVSSSNYYTDFFSNVPNDCLIIVKDTSCRSWVQARKSTLNNVKLVSELEG